MDKNNKDKSSQKAILSGDEILIRDRDGKFKILKEGKFIDLDEYTKGVKKGTEEVAPEETKKQIIAEPKPATPVLNFDELADEICKKSGLSLPDSLNSRLKSVVKARLKDVRDELETKDILTRSTEVGGIGLNDIDAQKILSLAGNEFKKIHKKGSVLPRWFEEDLAEEFKVKEEPKEAKISPAPVSAPVSALKEGVIQPKPISGVKVHPIASIPKAKPQAAKLAPPPPAMPSREGKEESFKKKVEVEKVVLPTKPLEIEKREEKRPEKKVEIKKEVLPPKPLKPEVREEPKKIVKKPLEVKEDKRDKKEEKVGFWSKVFGKKEEKEPKSEKKESRGSAFEVKKEEIKPQRPKEPEFRPVRRPTELETKRPKIEDVKFTPKLVGPIEELRSFSLTDFRRLSDNPSEATESIYQKIELLGEESFTKKNNGIESWQKSTLNGLYLDMGQESMEKGIPLSKVIDLRKSENRPTLSLEEFKAIMALNKKLKF